MQSNNDNKHEFSFYWPSVSEQIKKSASGLVVCDDQLLIHRIIIVLRMQIGSEFILFDYAQHAQVTLIEIHKKNIVLHIISYANNEVLQPTITMLLPLLKRDALEQALYSLVEVGVNTIQLILTEKVQRTLQRREYERLEKIIIAASEQSKQYAGVTLREPITLKKALTTLDEHTIKLYADPTGALVSTIYKPLKDVVHLAIMIGPEGDLTTGEKELVKCNKFLFCSLTPTVLRSVQAAGLFAGIWRTLLR